MSTLEQVRSGLGRAWEQLAEGWQQLVSRAGHALTRFQPVRGTGELQTAEDQLTARAPRWGPLAAEVAEDEEQVTVRLEAPGMEPDDFQVAVNDRVLVVQGEKQAGREQTLGRYHLLECAYGRFERAVPLPAAVDEAGARARYRRGVLTVTLPKTTGARGRRIQVNGSPP
ncbi:MAG TPA: Hsp20/alpha crystallin family protein [Gammaproteobacteria bacterium]|nr:Hsp20/alpha crystallin family protein [Gammaproteobacteria bacterium]